MKQQNKKGLIAIIALAVVLVTVAATYAFITFVIEGTKTNSITGGNLVVKIDESANPDGDITIDNAFPVPDATGKAGTAYKFTLKNESVKDVNYTISLVPQTVADPIPNSAIKVYLTNEGDTEVIKDVTYLNELGTGNTLATGILNGGQNKAFNLRVWIADTATDTDIWTKTTAEDGTKTTTGKQFASKISVESVQVAEYAVSVTNETQLLNQTVFYNGTATFDLTLGTGTPTATCRTSAGAEVTPTLDTATGRLTVANVTDHITCSVSYTG